jgi:hypothetical protein
LSVQDRPAQDARREQTVTKQRLLSLVVGIAATGVAVPLVAAASSAAGAGESCAVEPAGTVVESASPAGSAPVDDGGSATTVLATDVSTPSTEAPHVESATPATEVVPAATDSATPSTDPGTPSTEAPPAASVVTGDSLPGAEGLRRSVTAEVAPPPRQVVKVTFAIFPVQEERNKPPVVRVGRWGFDWRQTDPCNLVPGATLARSDRPGRDWAVTIPGLQNRTCVLVSAVVRGKPDATAVYANGVIHFSATLDPDPRIGAMGNFAVVDLVLHCTPR